VHGNQLRSNAPRTDTTDQAHGNRLVLPSSPSSSSPAPLKIVPQQNAWVVERLGKYDRTLTPGLNLLVPFVDRVAYKHSLKEMPLDVPSQVCITKDNTQLTVDGILYFQVTDPMRASYGSSDYIIAITQLAQTTLRSVVGKMELDKTFEERDQINGSVVLRWTRRR
jgi:regulator of protease activity HflC (stomatin/prohibitin superfamily)